MLAKLCVLRGALTTVNGHTQKLQALAMLRVLVADPASHALLVEQKVIPTIVGQVRTHKHICREARAGLESGLGL